MVFSKATRGAVQTLRVLFNEKTYTDTLAKVMTPEGLTEAFKILAGVLQGETLASYLFIIVVDYIMRTAMSNLEEPVGFTIRPRQSRRHPAEKLADVEFADDVALITDTIKEEHRNSYSVLRKRQGVLVST